MKERKKDVKQKREKIFIEQELSLHQDLSEYDRDSSGEKELKSAPKSELSFYLYAQEIRESLGKQPQSLGAIFNDASLWKNLRDYFEKNDPQICPKKKICPNRGSNAAACSAGRYLECRHYAEVPNPPSIRINLLLSVYRD